MKSPYEDYLGDGVYAVWDGYTITLDLRAQDSTTYIALEPQVLAALNNFSQRMIANRKAEME